ncbi:MAG: HesA/MoeB/ThiF family protein [Elusimicrobiales bacterium]|jgi:adenylyltransferase/sulfurtransferase
MPLSGQEKERYSRQLAVSGIGSGGQAKLKNASVLVAGAGGLGAVVSAYLAAAGVGRLGFADPGLLELSNLNRQIFYKTRDLGRAKTELLASFLKDLNPSVRLEPLRLKLDAGNLGPLLKKYKLVVDCTDNFEARFEMNLACFRAGGTLVHGAVYGFEGQLAVLEPRRGPCLKCAFPHTPPPLKGFTPVPGPVPGVLGAMQAVEVLKLVCGLPSNRDRLIIFDLARVVTHSVRLKKRRACPVCGKSGHFNKPV